VTDGRRSLTVGQPWNELLGVTAQQDESITERTQANKGEPVQRKPFELEEPGAESKRGTNCDEADRRRNAGSATEYCEPLSAGNDDFLSNKAIYAPPTEEGYMNGPYE
jgi:hypothetical protein